MAFYLNNDGIVNARVDLTSTIFIGATVGDYIEFDIEANSGNSNGNYRIAAGFQSGFNAILEVGTTQVFFRPDNQSNTTFNTNYTQPSIGQRFTLRLERVSSGVWECFINGGTIGTASNANDFRVIQFGDFDITRNEAFQGKFYRVTASTNGGASVTNDWNKQTLSGTNDTVFPDTAGGNDGTLVNFPTDNSQWVFYDDGQGGGDTLIPTLIPSGEVVGTPSVTNLLQLVEANAIPTQEAVQNPVIDTGAILISPATIPTGGVVYNVSVVDLTQFIEAEDIPTQEVVGSPSLELLLSRIFPTAIATQENFETPLIIGGDRIAIPINDRATWNRVAAYLRTRKFNGNDNDVILAWLRSEGYIDTFNDAFNTYLEDVEALDGSLTDKYSNWRRQ